METGIVKFEQFNDVVSKAPAVLQENKNSVTAAVEAGNTLLKQVVENGMDSALDSKINDYLKKLDRTLKKINEKRMPITRMLSSISSEFTTAERQLDKSRPETTYYKLQQARNDYAKKLADDARAKEEARLLEINKNQERETLKSVIDEHLKMKYNETVFSLREGLRVIFNDITLDDWTEGTALINDYEERVTIDIFRTWVPPYRPVYLTDVEKNTVIKNHMLPQLEKFDADLQVELATIKQEYITELPAKKNELMALAKADEAEQARIKREADERERKRLEQLAIEKKAADDKAREEALQKAKEAEITAHFEAQSVESDKPKPTGYTINVRGVDGYLAIMNCWYENEGKSLPFDKIEKMTIGRMKKFCEKHAHKSDEKIESPYLTYDEVYNQKVK